MVRFWRWQREHLVAFGLLTLGLAGCLRNNGREPEEIRMVSGWYDPAGSNESTEALLNFDQLKHTAEQVRAARKPKDGIIPPKRTLLALSGGGMYGAYSAGVLVGMTDSGTRPNFDVVTGISTGALISVFAFLGSETDCELKQFYTTMTSDNIFTKRRTIPALLLNSFADNAPLAALIDKTVTIERLAAVAVEHKKGRRLYVGTTDLEARRSVIWDMGEIASRGTPEDRVLFNQILLASAAIPGFFPPVPITVQAAGRTSVERHVDGGVTLSLFFAPPYVSPEQRATLPKNWLYGSDMYIIVAGKIYSDPAQVKQRSFMIAGSAITTVLYAQTRGDLQRLFLSSMLTGMNYHLASIPLDFPAPISSTNFDPVEMTKLFNEGYRLARLGTTWRNTPPGLGAGEGPAFRTTTKLVDGPPRPGVVGSGELGGDKGGNIPPVPVAK